MPSGFYEILGIPRTASPEEVRRAYKRSALQTHPDRLPPNVSAAEKSSAEEKFRQVNNAYEVLIDNKKRKEYDTHGVWPPPPPVPEHHRDHNTPGFNDPFFTEPSFSGPFFNPPHRRAPHSAFTDPFVLFNSLFDDIFHNMQSPHNNAYHPHDIFNPVQSHTVGFPFGFGSGFFGGFGSFPNGASQMMSSSYQTSYMNDGSEPRWISQSSMTRTINGVTETVQERIDSNGNKHVKIKHPDGRETYTINGVQQQPVGAIEGPRHDSHRSHHRSDTSRHDPPPHYEEKERSSRRRWG